ncbi:hypothetical protein [Streptomyces sp. WAC 04229]|nr:hypothetical protein [Streptomyces sp. WAC 04229]
MSTKSGLSTIMAFSVRFRATVTGPNACKKSSRGANPRPIATAAELA